MAPVVATTRAPTIRGISGLNSRASARAVYASPLGLPQVDARLASGCLASFPGGIGYPQGSFKRFPVCFLHPVLLSQAFPDATPLSAATVASNFPNPSPSIASTCAVRLPPPPVAARGGPPCWFHFRRRPSAGLSVWGLPQRCR